MIGLSESFGEIPGKPVGRAINLYLGLVAKKKKM
jgi:hypothetical protein